MATFTGTDADETIAPGFVSPTVVAVGGAAPGAGADTLDGGGGLDMLDGGGGADTLYGGLGDDQLTGGDGDDVIYGGDGGDAAFMGAGNDRFIWNPGDDNDGIEGEAGTDTFQMNGANATENFTIAPLGGNAIVQRDIASVIISLDDVERLELNLLGGADTLAIANLTGTDVTHVIANLAATLGGSVADNVADIITAQGRASDDTLTVTAAGAALTITGLPAQIVVNNMDAFDVARVDGGDGADYATVQGDGTANALTVTADGVYVSVSGLAAGAIAFGTTENVVLSGGAGDDILSATGNLAALTSLRFDGGAGADIITAGNGSDAIYSGDQNDIVRGAQGNDYAFLGANDDRYIWMPGDGSDTVEGGLGVDVLQFDCSAANEVIEILANGGRAALTRNIGAIVMDLDDMDRASVSLLGGTDMLTIGDLSGTDLTRVDLDLAGTIGGVTGDAMIDTIVARGRASAELITITGDAATMSVSGLYALLNISNAEAQDSLQIQAGDGADIIFATAARALIIDGGAQADTVSYIDAASAAFASLLDPLTNSGAAATHFYVGVENLTGSSFADHLTGDGGANVLDGAASADTMNGGAGADSYFVDNIGDVAAEASNDGAIDLVTASVSYTLSAFLDNLTLVGPTAKSGTGNDLNNVLRGNGAANVLNGRAGADEMRGGGGNDLYFVDNASDKIIEAAGAGTDTVSASTTYALSANVENLILGGGNAINGSGNGLANQITGNSGNNSLNGGFGSDTLTGGAGRDSFLFRDTFSVSNVDTITDYAVVDDTIRLDDSVFTNIGPIGALASGLFRIGAAAADATDRIIYNKTTGQLFYDPDGLGGAAQIHFATLSAGLSMTTGEFAVI